MGELKTIPVGQTFGRWTVLGPEKQDGGERRWLCRCACGTLRYVSRRSLVSGSSQSCGCLRSERVRAALAHDLTGKIFGELTVLGPVQTISGDGVHWNCRCSCGKEICTTATLLFTGKRSHCGCKADRDHPTDITGRRFGRLTAIEATIERDAKGSLLWRCRCDCGAEVT